MRSLVRTFYGEDSDAQAWMSVATSRGKDRKKEEGGREGRRPDAVLSLPCQYPHLHRMLLTTWIALFCEWNGGYTCSIRPKFIFVGYLPKAAPVMKRARCGGHKAEVKKAFHSIHVEFQIEDASEISKDEVVSKLRLSGGAHQPTSYEFGPVEVGTHAA